MIRLTDDERDLAGRNLGLAGKMAARVWNKAHRIPDLDDLYQAAVVGLCEATKLFDPDVGVQFSTYACKACYHAATTEAITRGVIYTPTWTGRPSKQDRPLIRNARLAKFPVKFTVNLHDHGDPASHEFEDCQDTTDMLRTINRRDRDLVRRWMRGDTYVSIGAAVGLSDTTTKQLIRRAIKKIRQQFNGATP